MLSADTWVTSILMKMARVTNLGVAIAPKERRRPYKPNVVVPHDSVCFLVPGDSDCILKNCRDIVSATPPSE